MTEAESARIRDTGDSESKKSAGGSTVSSERRRWEQRPEGNPFRGGEGILRFRELYTGRRRTDRTAWSDYFLSWSFLKNWRKEAFTRLMWETVQEQQAAGPPCREFLTELYIAYGLVWERGEFRADQSALFDGIEYIVEIAKLGPAIHSFKKNDPAMRDGFRDYRELLMIAVGNEWEDDQLLAAGKIIDRYGLSNLSDRPISNTYQYDLYWRHPKSIRLLTHFFRYRDLPDPVYRLLWNHLRLDTAVNGREKLLYGELREIVLEHIPGLGAQPRVSYKTLLREFYQYGTGTSLSFNEGKTEEERRRLDQFFEREDMQHALLDDAFVEEQVLHYWITKGSGTYFLGKLQDYYQKHPDAPYAEQALRQIDQVLDQRKKLLEILEDEQSGYTWGVFDLTRRAYVRYYLNTAFHLAQGIQNQVLLRSYLAENMPYSQKWSQALADPGQSGLSPMHPLEIRFGEDVLTVAFYPKHLEYRWNGSRKVPRFPGEELAAMEDDTRFWMLAPIAAAHSDMRLPIYQELMKRLARLPVHEEDIPVIADGITGHICRLDRADFPVCTLYAEKDDQLYGCEICKNDTMVLYEEEMFLRSVLPGGTYTVHSLDTAVRMGTRLLDELTREYDTELYIPLLPDKLLIKIPCHPEKVLADGDVTEDVIQSLLTEYFNGRISRMELAYGGHSLLFLRQEKEQKAVYGCFWFDHRKKDWYGLVSLPEVYATVDSNDVVYVPFGLGKLPNYLVHESPALSILPKIPEVFEQTACRDPKPQMMMWAPQIYRFEMRQRYNLARRLYGGYPPEQSCCQIQDRFYLPHLPVRMSYAEPDRTASEPIEVHKDKAGVQYQLSRYMWGQLTRLSLTWQYMRKDAKDNYGGAVLAERHLIIVQEGGQHQMLYLDDDHSHVSYLVADVREYLDADEKRCRKEWFRGRKVPGYLVHKDLRRIRDHLDLLLSEILDPVAIVDQFGEYAYDAKADYAGLKEAFGC